MSYPTGVFAPPTRSNGQTIDAEHVQSLQDEVTAIETLLLGTITHSLNVSGASTLATLQAGASTHASLSVTGGSTVGTLQAGASTLTSLSVSGGSTLATLQVAGSTFTVRPVAPPPDLAHVFLAATQDFGSSAASTVIFLAQQVLTNSSMHSTGTNPERLIPQSTGIYRITAQLSLTIPSAIATRQLSILDSSVTVLGQFADKSTDAERIQVTAYKRFDVTGGYVTVNFALTGSTMSALSGAGISWAVMEKL